MSGNARDRRRYRRRNKPADIMPYWYTAAELEALGEHFAPPPPPPSIGMVLRDFFRRLFS